MTSKQTAAVTAMINCRTLDDALEIASAHAVKAHRGNETRQDSFVTTVMARWEHLDSLGREWR